MTVTIIILCLSAILFVNGRIRSDLVAVCTALSLVLCGILSPEEALAGFANPIVIMMACSSWEKAFSVRDWRGA